MAARQNKPDEQEEAAAADGGPRDLHQEIAELRVYMEEQLGRHWVALQGVAGLDGVAAEVANIAAILAPLRNLVPLVERDALPAEAAQTLAHMRSALALERDDGGGLGLRRPADGAAALDLAPEHVPFIGQAAPRQAIGAP